MALTRPKVGERDACLDMLARLQRHEPVTLISDKGYAGRDFETVAAQLGAMSARLTQTRARHGLAARPSINASDPHPPGLRTRIAASFLALAAAIVHEFGIADRPTKPQADGCIGETREVLERLDDGRLNILTQERTRRRAGVSLRCPVG